MSAARGRLRAEDVLTELLVFLAFFVRLEEGLGLGDCGSGEGFCCCGGVGLVWLL